MPRWMGMLLVALSSASAQFATRADYVLLDASVQNPAGGYVEGLKKGNFHVFDDGKEMSIGQFAASDRPVTVGLIVDNSGSMQQKRPEVVTAGLFFAKASNPQDEFFVINFNNGVYFGLPAGVAFTDRLQVLHSALYYGKAVGETALYDAVAAGLQHLKEGHRDIRVLIVVSDGGDNVSKISFADLTREIEAAHATIYTIGLLDPEDHDLNPGVLRKMSRLSGGEFFKPATIGELEDVFERIARDIRNRYVLGFVPDYSHDPHTVHKLRVQVKVENEARLVVHARTSYLSTP